MGYTQQWGYLPTLFVALLMCDRRLDDLFMSSSLVHCVPTPLPFFLSSILPSFLPSVLPPLFFLPSFLPSFLPLHPCPPCTAHAGRLGAELFALTVAVASGQRSVGEVAGHAQVARLVALFSESVSLATFSLKVLPSRVFSHFRIRISS